MVPSNILFPRDAIVLDFHARMALGGFGICRICVRVVALENAISVAGPRALVGPQARPAIWDSLAASGQARPTASIACADPRALVASRALGAPRQARAPFLDVFVVLSLRGECSQL